MLNFIEKSMYSVTYNKIYMHVKLTNIDSQLIVKKKFQGDQVDTFSNKVYFSFCEFKM